MTVFIYRGTSMYPTLKDLDILHVKPYEKREMTRGDVIVFTHPDTRAIISHRIIRVQAGDIRTQGDNCNGPDPYSLKPENIVGYVHYIHRQDQMMHIHQGYIGRVTAFRVKVLR